MKSYAECVDAEFGDVHRGTTGVYQWEEGVLIVQEVHHEHRQSRLILQSVEQQNSFASVTTLK